MTDETSNRDERLRSLRRWLEDSLDGDGDGEPDDAALAQRLLDGANAPLAGLEASPVSDPAFGLELGAALSDADALAPGSEIGPFRIECAIGAGGMGSVYRAERVRGGFEQQVALKVLAGTRTDADSIRQFARERDMLARLEHPNIARMIDGGMTSDGRPWFAMEYVEGRAIDRYVDENRLSIRQRVELFLQVCRALEYAHSRLVLHRDIKPSNVLVTDAGQVKLLDFGLARILEPSGDESTVTQGATRWLTPQYASPEQVRGEATTVASEVYQLGALLYRLLCGDPPFDLDGATAGRVMETVCDAEPTRPSASWRARSPSAGDWPFPAGAATGDAVARRLAGDLDNIVLAALAKPPEKRYGTVGDLIDDLERHLEFRPVQARAATRRYRLAKFMRRYRAGVITAGSVFALVVAALVVISFQARDLAQQRNAAERESERARVEAMRAERVSEYLVSLFEAANPQRAADSDLDARDLLDQGRDRIRDLDDAPLIKARMLEAVGMAYRELMEFDAARDALSEARELFESTPGAAPEDLASTIRWLGRIAHQVNDAERAEALLREALAVLGPAPAPSKLQANILNHLGIARAGQRDFDAAEAYTQRALAMFRELGDQASARDIINNLGVLYVYTSRPERARPMFQEILAYREKALGPGHALTLQSKRNLAATVMDLGDLDTAQRMYEEVLPFEKAISGEDSPRVGAIWYRLGRIAQQRGHLDRAERLLRDARRVRAAKLGEQHSTIAVIDRTLGRIEVERGRPEAAMGHYETALSSYRAIFGPEHASVVEVQVEVGQLWLAEGRGEAALEWLRDAVATVKALESHDAGPLYESLCELTERLAEAGQTDLAVEAVNLAASIDAWVSTELLRRRERLAADVRG
jgi:serine/threonine-protein kinase